MLGKRNNHQNEIIFTIFCYLIYHLFLCCVQLELKQKEEDLFRSDELLRDKNLIVTNLEDEIKYLIDETENIEERMKKEINEKEKGKVDNIRIFEDLQKKEEERKSVMIENEKLKMEIEDIKLINEKEIKRLIENEKKAIKNETFRDFLNDSLKEEKQKENELSFKQRAEELLHQQQEQEIIMQKNIQQKNILENETAKLAAIASNQSTSADDALGATNHAIAADMERQTRYDIHNIQQYVRLYVLQISTYACCTYTIYDLYFFPALLKRKTSSIFLTSSRISLMISFLYSP